MEKKLIAAAVSSALALPMAAQAVEFSVSGHVNRAIVSVDDGTDANDGDLEHVDANSSETRFRFTGSEELDSGMTVGVNLEIGRPSDWRTRHANVYLSTIGGKITLGQGGTASDGMTNARLGGPSWLGGVTNWCAYHSDGDNPACLTNDGARAEVLRYDTPAIGPASIAISAGDNDYWDVMLKVAGSFGDAGYDIRVGHIAEYDKEVVTEESVADLTSGVVTTTKTTSIAPAGDQTGASAAVSFGQGTSVAVAWSKDKLQDNDYQYVEVDHSYGDGSVGVYYKRGDTLTDKGSLWGVGIGHSIGSGATVYAGYRQMKRDSSDDNTDLLVAGMRVTFN